MKKAILIFLLVFASLFLFSCAEEGCPHKYLSAHLHAPTCDKEGYTSNVCTTCQAEFKTNYVPPLGHQISETVFSPTCADVGYTYYSCHCGYSYTSKYLPPAGHTYEKTIIPMTCESTGYTEYTCTVCSYTYQGDFVEAPGHTITEAIYIPTKEGAGFTQHSCSACDYIYKDDFVFLSDIYGSGSIENTEILAQGIDVSVYQHTPSSNGYLPLDWAAIKEAGVDFAILKAGSNNSGKDPVFDMNYAEAKAAGVKLGAYFYSYAKTEDELIAEVDLLLTFLEGKEFEYPIYFDLEDPSLREEGNKDLLTSYCITFIDRLRENGYYGALYTNADWIKNLLHEDVLTAYCDIWYARYPTVSDTTLDDEFSWNQEEYGKQLGMWQYSKTGYIPDCGIKDGQPTDLNYCYKDYESIIKKYGLNGFDNDSIVQQ